MTTERDSLFAGHSMAGDELGPCPCGHRMAMCHRANAARYCPPSEGLAAVVEQRDELARALRKMADNAEWGSHPCRTAAAIALEFTGIDG